MPFFIRHPAFVITGAIQAYNRYGRGFRSTYGGLMKNLNMSSDEILNMQTEMMKKLLFHAYDQVPYYKRVFNKAGFHPKDFRELSDLSSLPILTKKNIKDNFIDLIALNIQQKEKILHRTGGTSGEPSLFYLPRELKGAFNYASLYRFYSWGGVKFGEPRVTIGGRLITKKPPFAMRNLAENQLYICAQYINSDNINTLISSIIKFKPSFIQGHPSAISLIAESMLNTGNYVPVKAVFTTSENLYPDQRNIIEKVFCCKIFDTYGMGEMVAMASECKEHNGYHLAPEYGVTEVINDNVYEDGIGELISTSLQNYAMPLIRYNCGDLGKLRHEKCPCGCNFPMLEKVYGRIDDIIKTKTGRTILPLTIRLRMKHAGLSDFQLIQMEDGSINVNIFEKHNSERMQREILTASRVLGTIFDKEDSINIRVGEKPIMTRNGKIQMVIKQNKKE